MSNYFLLSPFFFGLTSLPDICFRRKQAAQWQLRLTWARESGWFPGASDPVPPRFPPLSPPGPGPAPTAAAMLDFFTIFSKGGLVLWCFQGVRGPAAAACTAPVNALIRSVLLKVRARLPPRPFPGLPRSPFSSQGVPLRPKETRHNFRGTSYQVPAWFGGHIMCFGWEPKGLFRCSHLLRLLYVFIDLRRILPRMSPMGVF